LHHVTLRQFFSAWAHVGLQSFGGGSTTLYLMRNLCVTSHGWVSESEFAEYWGIVQIAPGINILAQTALIGWKVARLAGAISALLGLLLPSISITIAITALYAMIRDNPWTAAAIRGIIPATAGVGIILVVQMLRPAWQQAHREGRASMVISSAVIIAAPVLLVLTTLPAVVLLWGAGIAMAILFWGLHITDGA
jgi:chromate transporter